MLQRRTGFFALVKTISGPYHRTAMETIKPPPFGVGAYVIVNRDKGLGVLMNAEEIITNVLQFRRDHHEPKTPIVLSAGCALVIYGVRETCGDIDADVNESVYRRLRSKVDPTAIQKFGDVEYFAVNNAIDLHILNRNRKYIDASACFSTAHPLYEQAKGVQLYTLADMYEQKLALIKNPLRNPAKLEQDKADLDGIKLLRTIGLKRR